jgi:hypothetical protein
VSRGGRTCWFASQRVSTQLVRHHNQVVLRGTQKHTVRLGIVLFLLNG